MGNKYKAGDKVIDIHRKIVWVVKETTESYFIEGTYILTLRSEYDNDMYFLCEDEALPCTPLGELLYDT